MGFCLGGIMATKREAQGYMGIMRGDYRGVLGWYGNLVGIIRVL